MIPPIHFEFPKSVPNSIFVYVRKTNKTKDIFYYWLDEIKNNLETVCRGMINPFYFDNDIYPYIKEMFFLIENFRESDTNKAKIISFVIGREQTKIMKAKKKEKTNTTKTKKTKNKDNTKKRKEKKIKYFYIDAFCSTSTSPRDGSDLRGLGKVFFTDILNVLKARNVYEFIALRASLPRLLKYYEQSGFLRKKNACNKNEKIRDFNAIEGYDELVLNEEQYVPLTYQKWNYYKLFSRKRRKHSSNKYKGSMKRVHTVKNPNQYACDYVNEAEMSSKNKKYFPKCFLRDGWWMTKCIK